MKPRQPPGNGSNKIHVHQEDMGGWVRVFTDKTATLTDDLPLFLSHTLAEWFRQRRHLRMRCAVPICRDGNTVEIHAWYETHVFEAYQGPQAEEERTRGE